VRAALARIDRDQPISDVRAMEARVARSLTARRFNTVLIALFGALALMLSAIGIYGVVAYAVTERTHEIGVRVALGARPRDVVAMVLRQGVAMIVAGTAVGVAAALAATRVIASLLFGVGAGDPATFIAIPVLLAAVSLAACYIPARRATRVDPLAALRSE
jgi:putative ABC transport system permease protein